MNAEFDAYRSDYEAVVQKSIDFSGLPHDFFLKAKADRLRALFHRHFGVDATPSLLDVGCGVGRLHEWLRPFVGRLAGSDVSADSLERARVDNTGVEYRTSTQTALPWETASFDAVLAVCVLHHVPLPDRPRLMSEMRRVIRPDGLAVIIEHNPWNPLTRLAVWRCPFDADAVLLGAGRARRLLAAMGLRDIQSRHFLALPPRLAHEGLENALAGLPIGAQYLAAGTA